MKLTGVVLGFVDLGRFRERLAGGSVISCVRLQGYVSKTFLIVTSFQTYAYSSASCVFYCFVRSTPSRVPLKD